jgi:tetratricopeptide (TPR) repeat protein
MAVDDRRHPEAERLAEYADGVLDAASRAEVDQHLADCADCRAVVMETMAFLDSNLATLASEAPKVVPFRPRRWVRGVTVGLAAAARAAARDPGRAAGWVSGLFGPTGDRPELQELIAAVASEPTRPVEGRLSGGFKYGPPPSPTRGAPDREASPDVRIAAAKIEKAAGEKETPEARAALGAALLVLGDTNKGVLALEVAAQMSPDNAFIQNDLTAAYLARSRREGGSQDLARAISAAGLALKSNPDLIEALFNRALGLEMLGPASAARDAWNAYLKRDASSAWADEARRRLELLRSRVGRLVTESFGPVRPD